MGLLRLRRQQIWEPPTLLDNLLDSPLALLVYLIYKVLLYFRGTSYEPPLHKPRIRAVIVSDTHSNKTSIPNGDILIHCGDLTNSGSAEDIQNQIDWLSSLPHKHKIMIAGNHDSYFDPKSRLRGDRAKKLDLKSIIYLEDSGVELKFKGNRKLNFWGAPDIPACGGTDFAFQYDRDHAPWENRIPLNTDVLITHTPPKSHLDLNLGCRSLLEEIWHVKPRLHVFGHVHSGHGREPVFWCEGQRAYERIKGREKRGFWRDFIPSRAWYDAFLVVWAGVQGILWRFLMKGPSGANGGLLVNAAMVYQTTTDIGHSAQIVEL